MPKSSTLIKSQVRQSLQRQVFHRAFSEVGRWDTDYTDRPRVTLDYLESLVDQDDEMRDFSVAALIRCLTRAA
ncbi:MAG: hypothetical protein AAYR33_07775 [Acetobacteraceae bacterium]